MRWLAVLLVVAGCGYSFVAPGLPPALGVTAVTEFSNDTTQAGLGHDCTEALRDRVMSGGNPGVAASGEGYVVVVGRVTSLTERPVAAGAGGVDMALEVSVAVRVVRRDGSVLYDGEVRGVDSARATPEPIGAAQTRAVGARRACEEAMDELVELLGDAIAATETDAGHP